MAWIVVALLCMTASAFADARMFASQPRLQPKAEGLCDHVLHAARLGISSGKVIFTERASDGRVRAIGAQLGSARIMPALDLTFHSAAIVARIVF